MARTAHFCTVCGILLRGGGAPSRLEAAGPKQKQDNQYEQTYAAQGIKTPLLAVPPNRKNSHEGYDEKCGKNERQHVLDSPFWPAPSGLILFRFGLCDVRKTGQAVPREAQPFAAGPALAPPPE